MPPSGLSACPSVTPTTNGGRRFRQSGCATYRVAMTVRRVVVDHVLFVVADLEASRRALYHCPRTARVRGAARPGGRRQRYGADGLDDFAISRGEPGVWTQYSERYYAAFVNDLYGNNVEAVWHAPEPVLDAPLRPGVP